MAFRKLDKPRTPEEARALKREWFHRTYQPRTTEPPCKVGDVFCRLTVIEMMTVGNGRYRAKAECVCGEIVDHPPRLLVKGRVKSCGCLMRDLQKNVGNIRFGGMLP